ncbi:bile acid:sodium symporter family protein [Paracoccus sp. CPCC 101403]|uniref:Bile acid:sodium symporter family protein n=1 Tax=Paracoccus broussonetiae TaxID=3075834 RepID=A0ABU3EFY9_9RHOB|nr:bile acid:sodium symporter family protein [Paracoccus sp. CPCC 101403]MDT1062360.1 bile acid:sodium symporter family protein [Paracoccus sp. CPCC 101403]
MKKLDPFLMLMIGAVVLATLAPATGRAAGVVDGLGTAAVAMLFFLHGAALSPRTILDGLKQWQLHLFILMSTFVVFPVIVLPLRLLPEAILPADLALGFVYLGVLPSAVSSSIAYTAMARGNVPAAVCNSAGSNVLGLLLTPLLMSLLIGSAASGAMDLGQTLRDVCLQLLLPFGLGQLAHRWIGNTLQRNGRWLSNYDQGVIVLIIYAAFSQSVTGGLWQVLPLGGLVMACALCLAILLVVIAFTTRGARFLGLSREDEIAAVFCGSKKSLASGLPLAQVLFAGATGFGMIVLPIMLYNQIQIMVGAVLARRYAERAAATSA